MIVNFLLIVPLLTVLTLLLVKNEQYIKPIALVGSFVQLLVIIGTLIQYLGAASLKNNGAMLLQTDVNWFAPLHIHYHIGVDGISMVMLLFTALIVIAAILVSWKEAFLQKEFFILLILLSFGAYGFFLLLLICF